jgi:hypothetical protein
MRGHWGWGGGDFKGTTGEGDDDMGSQEDYKEDRDGPCQVLEGPRGAMS